jgi:large subunit ribosomal protein L30
MAKKSESGKKFELTQVRGKSGCTESQIRTLTALGLRGRHKTVIVNDSPAARGQIMKVQHLINVALFDGKAPSNTQGRSKTQEAKTVK